MRRKEGNCQWACPLVWQSIAYHGWRFSFLRDLGKKRKGRKVFMQWHAMQISLHGDAVLFWRRRPAPLAAGVNSCTPSSSDIPLGHKVAGSLTSAMKCGAENEEGGRIHPGSKDGGVVAEFTGFEGVKKCLRRPRFSERRATLVHLSPSHVISFGVDCGQGSVITSQRCMRHAFLTLSSNALSPSSFVLWHPGFVWLPSFLLKNFGKQAPPLSTSFPLSSNAPFHPKVQKLCFGTFLYWRPVFGGWCLTLIICEKFRFLVLKNVSSGKNKMKLHTERHPACSEGVF